MASKIQPGKFSAKIVDYSMRKTQKGDPEPIVRFEWVDKAGDKQQYNWRGSLKEGKAREITLNALLVCGLSNNDLSLLCDGVESGLLDTEKLVSIAVELEKGQDGKEYAKIAWINDGSAGDFKDEMTKDEAKTKLTGMGVANDVSALLATKGKTLAKRASAAPMETASVDQIPF